jgi:hypothetical protein
MFSSIGRNFTSDSSAMYKEMKNLEKTIAKSTISSDASSLEGMRRMHGSVEGIDYKISVKMAGETRLTTITALDTHTGEKIGEISFEKSKEARGKRTKDMDKKLNTFLTDTKCHKYLGIAKNNTSSLDDRKAAIAQLASLYTSPSISPAAKQEIEACIQSMYREATIESNIAYFGLNESGAKALANAIPQGRFPDITNNPGNPFITMREKEEDQDCGGCGSYYPESVPEGQEKTQVDMILLNDDFISRYNPQDPDQFMEPIAKMLRDPETTLEKLNEALSQVKARMELIQNNKVTELREMINCWPSTVSSKAFKDGTIETIPVGQRISKLSVALTDLTKLKNKISEKIATHESDETAPQI